MRPFESENLILCQLADPEFLALERIWEPLILPRAFELVHFGMPVSHYYFLENGIASMVATSPEGRKAEIGVLGRDGMSPPALTVDAERFSFDVMMQIGGHGHRVEAGALTGFLAERPAIRRLLSRSLHTFFKQVANTALSNAVHKIDVRLAKWILMCHDRLEGEEIEITHEYMATMLGVRRSSVTDALHVLEGEHLIYSTRGLVVIRNRTSLEAFAADAYNVPGITGRDWPRTGRHHLAMVRPPAQRRQASAFPA
ncbi:Crp/Fnr family transcriptional regulator [Rhizobium sp. BR 249]|uniref:Crp/Fnr family transcriptional regulator n=1 Tax=Rhizobium sp. BR 249 TaxID=3040011 RepID=UPI0039BED403